MVLGCFLVSFRSIEVGHAWVSMSASDDGHYILGVLLSAASAFARS